MKPLILFSVISITTALVLYTIAVWRNWRMQRLTTAQVVLLWLGLVADVAATRMMALSVEGEIVWDFHTISGYTGLALMAVLASVGSWARWKNHAALLGSFHRLAVPIWLIWVASYISGVIIGMQRV